MQKGIITPLFAKSQKKKKKASELLSSHRWHFEQGSLTAVWKPGTLRPGYAIGHHALGGVGGGVVQGRLFIYHDEEKLKAWDLLTATGHRMIAVIFWEDQMTNIISYRWVVKIH